MKRVSLKKTHFTEYDSYLFHEGKHYALYEKMGAHLCMRANVAGTNFTVWAPSARDVSVITENGGWNAEIGRMKRLPDGVWELFVPGVGVGSLYRYVITGADGVVRYKSDPMAFASEKRPQNASIVYPLGGYRWHDKAFCEAQKTADPVNAPMAIYEVHLGSWKKAEGSGKDDFLNYRVLADQLVEYVTYMGYTHVELIGICEHPLDASWGYQVTGFFSPTSRYGSPDDFRYFVDTMHRHGIGVILDFVPAHFPKDAFGLADFDGAPLYESEDPLRAEYPEWGTKAFDHGKPEVRNFLISGALYWVREFHVDALRIDAVAAMLYTNFSREKWRPNIYGGTENLESIAFLRELNHVLRTQTSAYLIAEDSSIMPDITTSVDDGGMGFLFKWNMGWMNDTLRYIGKDPLFRGWHHEELTHSTDYAFLENYVLVLSHDEVVHLKHSMLEKFPGTLPDKLGGLKTLYTYMFTHPGKKLLFMGQDFAQEREWSEERSLDWHLADDAGHRDVMLCVRDLLTLYRKVPCLYTDSRNPTTFEWVNRNDAMRSTISYIRRNPWNYDGALLVICNFAPVAYEGYACGVPVDGAYARIFSTYDHVTGGGGADEIGVLPPVLAEKQACDGYDYRLTYHLRPYESVIFRLPTPTKTEEHD